MADEVLFVLEKNNERGAYPECPLCGEHFLFGSAAWSLTYRGELLGPICDSCYTAGTKVAAERFERKAKELREKSTDAAELSKIDRLDEFAMALRMYTPRA
jgi:hypothetical protein